MKTCSKCGEDKPKTEFTKNKNTRDKLTTWCRDCNRLSHVDWRRRNPEKVRERHAIYRRRVGPSVLAARNRRRLYGLSEREYAQLLQAQNGVCAICNQRLPLQVDHCHQTNNVRGLLCGPCNRFLGQAQDNPLLLRAGAAYLEARP